jgi:predicted sugar kinase
VPQTVTRQLEHLARHVIVPAARVACFAEFADAVYEYGYLAGTCFAETQGGAFAGPQLTELVRQVRAMGVRGAGQSSWGPTVFGVLPDEPAARWFVDRIRRRYAEQELCIVATGPNNLGAKIEVI